MTLNERKQSGQEKSLLARHSSCPEEPISEMFWNDVSQQLPPSRSFLMLSTTTTEKLHYQHNSSLK